MKISTAVRKGRAIKRGKGERVFMGIMFVLFTLYALSVILPFLWILMNSLKSNDAFFVDRNAFPVNWQFKNYGEAFTAVNYNGTDLAGMFFNSILLTVENSIAAVVFPLMAAYVVAKYPYKICKFLYGLALVVQVLPTIGALPVEYQLVYNLGLNDNLFFIWLFLMYFFS